MNPTNLPIDLETETIQFDGNWYSRDDLARRIKAMLDKGDFAISKPSQALEQLTATLGTVKPVTVKLTNEMIEALNQIAARQQKTVGSLIREAVGVALSGGVHPNPPPPPPAALVPGAPGPKNAPPELESTQPIALTTKKKDEEPAERGWFGG